jgi:hypothetical protein
MKYSILISLLAFIGGKLGAEVQNIQKCKKIKLFKLNFEFNNVFLKR